MARRLALLAALVLFGNGSAFAADPAPAPNGDAAAASPAANPSPSQPRAQEFQARAQALLDKAKAAIVHAQKPADLDDLLPELQVFTNSSPAASDYASQLLMQKVETIRQFAVLWQNYLSAAANGKDEETRNALRQLLNSPQFDGLQIFPRSRLLALRDGSATAAPAGGNATVAVDLSNAIDAILSKVVRIDQIEPALDKITKIPNQPWDFSNLLALDKDRHDAAMGLPFNLNLKAAMNGGVQGTDISRIVALELLGTLPYYFNTQASDPPKAGETVDAYLDRLANSGNAAGDFGLLQRAMSVKIALAMRIERYPVTLDTATVTPAQFFLAGLSQEEAAQYPQAVVSYQKSLKDFDRFLPHKIVGQRLEAIKNAHPDEYKQGMNVYEASLIDYRMMPYSYQAQRQIPPSYPQFVLPIPEIVGVPSRPPAPPGKNP